MIEAYLRDMKTPRTIISGVFDSNMIVAQFRHMKVIKAYLRHMKTARTRPEAARMLKSQAVRRKKSVSRDRRVCNIV